MQYPMQQTNNVLCTSSTNHFVIWLAIAALGVLSGCASGPNLSALEDDELYLQRGEEFITDAAYLAFALEQSGFDETLRGEDDYYNPDQNNLGIGGQYQPHYMQGNHNFQQGLGLSSYFQPFGMGGMGCNSGFGYNNGYGYNNGGFGLNNSLGYNPYGYNPYGYNPYGYNPYGYNPYGYNPYGYNGYGYNGYGYNYGGWTSGSNENDDSGSGGVLSGPRTPIMSTTGVNSNYGDNGMLLQPKTSDSELEMTAPQRVSPTELERTAPRSRGLSRWLTPASTPLEFPSTTPQGQNRMERGRNNSSNTPAPSISSPRTSPRSNSSSPSTRPSGGGNRPAGTSRSNRDGQR